MGFAVLGGAFAEGIDLPGDRLIGAFIATLGLPQVNPVNEQIRRRLDTLVSRDTGSGFDCAYLFPGVQKVVQAAGRVIRSESDRGLLVVCDSRLVQMGYGRRLRAALPPMTPLASEQHAAAVGFDLDSTDADDGEIPQYHAPDGECSGTVGW